MAAISWDGILSGVIILFIMLSAWAKWEQKQIMDLLKELREFVQDWKDGVDE